MGSGGGHLACAGVHHALQFLRPERLPGRQQPYAVLAQGADGNFYGTTEGGGPNGWGTVFQITPSGSELTILHSFSSCDSGCPNGNYPEAGLVLATNGNFYGTTFESGNGLGTVFTMTPGGKLTTLSELCEEGPCPEGGVWGQQPVAPLIQATNGDLYGTTQTGPNGGGTVFKITPAGTLTILYTFCSQGSQDPCPSGSTPVAPLVQAANGDLYGTTELGGNACDPADQGCGTVFRITPSGNLTTLHRFCRSGAVNCPDGKYPTAGLAQGSDGNFYGTTSAFGPGEAGTVFKMTATGELTTLYSFCSQPNCADGSEPVAGLVVGTDGNFYGTTVYGGVNNTSCNSAPGCGTVFKITPGVLTTVYSFCSQPGCADGSFPSEGSCKALMGASTEPRATVVSALARSLA